MAIWTALPPVKAPKREPYREQGSEEGKYLLIETKNAYTHHIHGSGFCFTPSISPCDSRRSLCVAGDPGTTQTKIPVERYQKMRKVPYSVTVCLRMMTNDPKMWKLEIHFDVGVP